MLLAKSCALNFARTLKIIVRLIVLFFFHSNIKLLLPYFFIYIFFTYTLNVSMNIGELQGIKKKIKYIYKFQLYYHIPNASTTISTKEANKNQNKLVNQLHICLLPYLYIHILLYKNYNVHTFITAQ